MIAVFTNAIAILIGSAIGLLFKKAIPSTWTDVIMKGIGLIVIFMGIKNAMDGENLIITIICMVIGTMIGEGIDIDTRFNGFANRLESKFASGKESGTFAQGFVTASLLFCVGAMTVVGSLNAGLKGDNTLLYTKTVLDGVSSVLFSASLGIGVPFAAVVVIVIQGGIVLLASFVEPFLTTAVVNEMTCVGSLLIMGLGFNLALDSKLKIMNYMPAMLLPVVVCPLYQFILGLF